uniref:Uncharacterized protein n=1 Tax=Glossina palpalis gambiensis TaxID=67801 RepID=A0A1B0BM12_9MUSC
MTSLLPRSNFVKQSFLRDKNESRATLLPRGGNDKPRKGEPARKGAKSSISHQKGSRVKADIGIAGLGSNISLKRFLGWKMGSPVVHVRLPSASKATSVGRGPQRPALTGVGLGEPARSKTLGLSNLRANSSSNGSNELARNRGRVKGAKLVARSNTDGPRVMERPRGGLGPRDQQVGGGT